MLCLLAMGKHKRDRQGTRQQRPSQAPSARKPTAAVEAPEVHITVATMPAGDIADALVHDAALAKAALLYADHVTLASTNAIMFASLTGFTTPNPKARRDALLATLAALPGNEAVVATYEDLSRRRRSLSRVELQALLRIEAALKTSGEELAEATQTILDQAGMPELQRAMEAGVLGVHLLDLEGAEPGEFASRAVEGLVKVLSDAVSGRARTYPMFDDGAGNLVELMLAEGRIAGASPGRGKQVGAAGLLIGQLEAFPDAEMDVVLDVRQKLKPSLTRFRAALAAASAELETPAWQTEEFAREVEDLYHRRVAPALLDLEQAMEELGAGPTLRRAVADVENLKAGAAIAVGAVAGMDLAHLPHVIFGGGLGALATAASATARERGHRAEAHGQAQANEFYFLYEANRQLAH